MSPLRHAGSPHPPTRGRFLRSLLGCTADSILGWVRTLLLLALVLMAAKLMHGQLVSPTLPAPSGSGQCFLSTGAGSGKWGWTSCPGGGGVPTGAVVMIATGTCTATLGSGWAEVATGGNYVLATVAANADVGTTGGSLSYTPAGTVAAPTVNSLTAAAQTISGSTAAEASHTHAVTSNVAQNAFTNPTLAWPVGVPTNASGAFTDGAISWPVGVPVFTGSAGTVPAQTFTGSSATSSAVSGGTPAGTNGASATSGNCAATNIAAGTGSTTACKATAPNLTVTAQTFTGSALATHTHTLTATGTNGTAAFTPAGTNAWPADVPTIAAGSFTQPTISWPVGVPTASGGSVSLTNNAVTSGAGSSHLHAAGTLANGTSAVTGTLNAPGFTGSAATIQPSFIKLIFCQKS